MTNIGWNHPLAVAARTNDALADERDLDLPGVCREVGLLDHGSFDEVYHLARQRALRALSIVKGVPVELGSPVTVDSADELLLHILTASYLDGLATGWAGHASVTSSDPPFLVGAQTAAVIDDQEVI